MLNEIVLLVDLLSKTLFFLGYFSGFKRLPPPLSEKEEKEIFLSLQNGDKTAKDALVRHNLRLVVHVAKKYQSSPIEMEDLISIGSVGLIKAVNSFDPLKQTRFGTFAAKCIDNEILMALRAHMRSATNIYLDDVIATGDDGSRLSLVEMLSCGPSGTSDFDSFENTLTAKSILSLVDRILDKMERTVIKYRYAQKNPLTQAQIAAKLGVSRSYVSRIEKRAIEKLAKHALK